MDFDTILEDIGSWGKHQKKIVFYFIVPLVLITPHAFNYIFILGVPEHWCHVPGRESTNHTLEEWKAINIPRLNGTYDKCKVLNQSISLPNYGGIHSDFNSSGLEVSECPTNQWDFDDSLYQETAVSYYGWVCQQSILPTYIITVGFVGSLIGSIVSGNMADIWLGRKICTFFMIAVKVIASIGMICAPPTWLFFVMHFLAMSTFPGIYQVPFVLVSEQVGKSQRLMINLMSFTLWSVGNCLLALIVWLLQGHWRYVIGSSIALYTPFLFLYRLLPESPRWLISQGRYGEAHIVCEKICRTNGVKVPPNLRSKLEKVSTSSQGHYGFLSLFSTRRMGFRSFAITFVWMTIAAAYNVFMLNIRNLAGNAYFNYFLMSVIEFGGLAIGIFGIKFLGRKIIQTICLLMTATTLFITGYYLTSDGDSHIPVIVLSVLGKMTIKSSFFVMYQQAMEIYPTVVRSAGLALGATVANFFCIFVPMFLHLGTMWPPLPFIIFGSILGVSVVLSLYLPETANQKLPETIEEADAMGFNQRFCYIPALHGASASRVDKHQYDLTQTKLNEE